MRKLHFAISKIAIPMTPAMEYLRGCQADQASTKQTPIGTGGVLSLLRTAHHRHEILVVPCIVCASRVFFSQLSNESSSDHQERPGDLLCT